MNRQLGTMENVYLDGSFSSSLRASFCKRLIYLEMEKNIACNLRGMFERVLERVRIFTSVRSKNEIDDIYRHFVFPGARKEIVCHHP